MNPIRYTLKELKEKTVPIGREGENEYTVVSIDCAEVYEEYPAAVASMKVQNPNKVIYPVVIERSGNDIIWTVKASDLTVKGDGRFQLTFTEGTVIHKTVIGRTLILKSLVADGPVPEAVEDWIDEATELMEDMEEKRDSGYFKGDPGDPGAPGHSPVLTADKVGKTTTIYSDGTQLAQILDGQDGQAGAIIDDTTPAADKVFSSSKVNGELTQLKSEIQEKPEVKDSTKTGVDFDVSDPSGNVLVRFKDGHIQTKNFDSKNIGNDMIRESETTDPDFDISDVYGNVVGRFVDGGIVVKQFDGRKYTTFSKSGSYVVGQSLTLIINKDFKKDDRIVLHIENGAAPWTSGGRVAYYAGEKQITENTWRGAEAYLEYKLTEDVSSISAVLPTNAFYDNMTLAFEVSLLGDVPIQPTIVTIKKDGSGDFTNLRACLMAIGNKANDVLNPYRIEIYPGTYDVLVDYTEEEMENVYYGTTAINQYSQTSFVGPKLLNGMSLIGMGRPEDVILTAWLDPEPTDDLSKRQRGQISTLNLQGSGSVENLTIIAQNMRYCVHDDFSAPLGKKCKRIVKNCIFRGYNIAYGPHTTYGAGMPQGGMDFLFVGCDFGEDVGVHTQELLYQRPVIHLINCKGHSFRIGDNETVDPITEYTIYKLDSCDFLDVRQGMKDTVPHAKLCGTGGSFKFYQLDPQTEYNTGEITIVPLSVLGTALTVGTCVEMYTDNANGPRFKAITDLDNFAGVVVFVDEEDNTYIQTRGYVRTDRLGLSGFSMNDYVGLDGTACDVVASASDAFGKITYIDYDGEGYVKLGGRF